MTIADIRERFTATIEEPSALAVPVSSAPQPYPDRPRSNSPRVIALGVVVVLLYYGRPFFITAALAIVLAFILEPFVSFLTRLHIPRALAAALVICLSGTALYFATFAAWTQVAGFASEMPRITERLGALVDDARDTVERMEDSSSKLFSRRSKQVELPPALPRSTRKKAGAAPKIPAAPIPGAIPEVRIHEDHNIVADYIYSRLGKLYQSLLMASFIPFLVYFMLSWQEHLHRNFLQFFSGEARVTASRSVRGVADLVRAFVAGNFVLGILLSITSSLAFWVIGLPYPFLAGPISGFLSLLPYLGLPMAMMVPGFISLAGVSNVSQLALVAAIVTTLHLIALNLLYPKVVGARVHLNPLAVTFALMFWSFLWDASGLVLAIPITAAIKAVCDNVPRLRPYGRLLGD